jgi:hypothetical protein
MYAGARRLTVACLVSLLVLATPSAVATDVTVAFDVEAGAYGNEVRISSEYFNYPRLAIDLGGASPRRGTMYVLGLTNITCADIVVSTSSDGGGTISAPTVASGLCLRGPSLDVVMAPDGAMYVATWGPQILRSSDGGLSWELLATLANSTVPSVLALDPDGTLYVAWSDGPWGTPGAGSAMVSVSHDGGGNWTAPVSILPPGISGSSAQIAATGSKVVVAYVGEDAGARYVAVVNSTDAGASWGAETRLSSPFPCAWVSAPSVAASAIGTFAVSWYSEPATAPAGCWDNWGNQTEVYVAMLSDSLPPTIWRFGSPAWPTVTFGDAIAFDDRSQAYVTWHSIAPEWSSASVYVAAGGRVGSLSTTLRVPGGNSTQQENLAAGPGGSMWLVWTVVNYFDPTDPRIGIYVRRVAGGAVVEVAGAEAVSRLAVEMEHPSHGSLQGTWTGAPLRFADLPPGMHELRIREGNASTYAASVPVDAFGITTITLRIGQESAPFPWTPVLLAAAAMGAAIGTLVWMRQRRHSQRQVTRGRR